MKYQGDRLSVSLKVKVSPAVYSCLQREAWKDHKTNSQWVRDAITKMLMERGVTIPEPLSYSDRANTAGIISTASIS
jgi:hypothetical protein